MQPLQGRGKELHQLSENIFSTEYNHDSILNEEVSIKAICITGETGIGKTSLAYELFHRTDQQRYRNRFEEKLAVTCYMDDWDHVITILARGVLSEIPSKVNSRELETNLLTRITEKRYLVLIDNIDQVKAPVIRSFITRWVEGDHRSMLLLTVRNSPFGGDIPKGCTIFPLEGISEPYVVDNLLSEEFVERIEKAGLRDSLKQLGNNPQKLLFLRWRALSDEADIAKCILDLKEGAAGVESVEMVLQRIPYPIAHFLALGRMRDSEFDETLLAFLWDRLGGGSTETYVRALKLLLTEKLLVFEQTNNGGKFRLSAGVHLGLKGPLLKHIGEKGVARIDYFISEYYRTAFTSTKDEAFNLKLLEQYVYHALDSGNFDSPYSYVFESDILDIAHNRGLSLELEPILCHIDHHWSGLVKTRRADPRFVEQGARIKIELGRIYKDLSQHQSCLVYLEKADQFLESPAGAGISEDIKRRFRRKIWHYSAISKSQIGSTNDCLDFYLRVVKDAAQYGEFTPFDALSLGYLAYELKYQNIIKAEVLGRKALELSEKMGDNNAMIKNMCSLGQTLFFMDKRDEARSIFDRAEELSKQAPPEYRDDRELGRILINSVVVYISNQDWEGTANRLNECQNLNKRFGDRRRAAAADAFRAIMHYKMNGHREEAKEEAKAMMLIAISQHLGVESWRELVNEALTYIWIAAPELASNPRHITGASSFPQEVQACVKRFAEDEHLGVFIDFWSDRFKPLLLEP
jgi:hypothetical protein